MHNISQAARREGKGHYSRFSYSVNKTLAYNRWTDSVAVAVRKLLGKLMRVDSVCGQTSSFRTQKNITPKSNSGEV